MSGADYVGFRVEKITDSSESISNSTGESSLAAKINAKSAEAADMKYNIGGASKIAGGFVDGVVGSIRDGMAGLGSSLGLGGAIEVMSGNARIDMPDVWKSSSFSKSYSFSINLRSRYGDPVSIFQSIYVPLAMLLAGALPRSVGKNSYTSPFVLRAYCKGMFAIPLGMIESISIRRGLPEFGWNVDNLPTAVSISMNIKDLSPAMYCALADNTFVDIFGANTTLQEYLTTLSGVGLAERYYMLPKLKRKKDAILLATYNNWVSPHGWGTRIGNMALVKAAAAVMSIGQPGNVSNN
jgi:hypothetical protein